VPGTGYPAGGALSCGFGSGGSEAFIADPGEADPDPVASARPRPINERKGI